MADKTRTTTNVYVAADEIGQIPFNSIIFTNEGTSTVIVNSRSIAPGDSFADNGNEGELNYTQYRIKFVPNVGLINRCVVSRKDIVNSL